jgi:hypothetical protein
LLDEVDVDEDALLALNIAEFELDDDGKTFEDVFEIVLILTYGSGLKNIPLRSCAAFTSSG